MKRTPLFDEHIKLNAKMIDFSGWEMPLEYTKILEEHMAVREHVGIFDVSHMGDVLIEGKDSKDFVDYLFPTKVSNLSKNQCVYTAFLNDSGNIIDDTIIYRLDENRFFFVPNAGTIEKMVKWANDHKGNYDVSITDLSTDIASIALQGPESVRVMKDLEIEFPDPFTFLYHEIDNYNELTKEKNMIVSGTGYTGEKGVEFILPAKYAPKLWNILLNELNKYSGKPCGLGSRDTLRMEKGMLLSGHDFNEDRTPFECSISFIVNNDGKFIGKEKLMESKSNYTKQFRGFILDERAIPRQSYPIFSDSEKIGQITSGTLSPILGKGVGLGYIDRKYMKAGTRVEIEIRGKRYPTTVSRPKIVP